MIVQLIKLILLIVVIFIGLKIFAPDTYDSIVGSVSEKTGLEKSQIDTTLDKIEDKAKDGFDSLKEKASEKIDQIKESAQ